MPVLSICPPAHMTPQFIRLTESSFLFFNQREVANHEANSSSQQDGCGLKHLKNACTWQECARYQPLSVIIAQTRTTPNDARTSLIYKTVEDVSEQARFQSGTDQKGGISPPLL